MQRSESREQSQLPTINLLASHGGLMSLVLPHVIARLTCRITFHDCPEESTIGRPNPLSKRFVPIRVTMTRASFGR